MKLKMMSFVVAVALVSAPSFAASKTVSGATHPASRLEIGPSLLVSGGGAFGVNLGVGFAVDHTLPIYVGLDSGFYFASGTGASAVLIPIMASVVYRFNLPTSPNIHPYAGMGIGAVIGSFSIGTFGGGTGAGFAMEFRPGIEIALNPSVGFFVEPRFGIWGSSFVFIPTAGLNIPF